MTDALDSDDWNGLGVRLLRNWRAEDARERRELRALAGRIRAAAWDAANRDRKNTRERQRRKREAMK